MDHCRCLVVERYQSAQRMYLKSAAGLHIHARMCRLASADDVVKSTNQTTIFGFLFIRAEECIVRRYEVPFLPHG